jgi:ribosomal protein S27AE
MKKILDNNWFIGISCSLIASIIYALGNNVVIIPYVNYFLNLNFKIWQFSFAIMLLSICYFAGKILFFPKKFLTYKSDNWSNINWVWDWKKSNKSKLYIINNLNMLCPNCNNGVFTVASMYSREYSCVKCGFTVPTNQFLKPSFDQIRDEIYSEIRRDYPNETKYIDHT